MNILYIRGDLFSTPVKHILHGCNSRGVMGSGVARVVKEKYTPAYECYRRAYESATDKHLSSLPLGDVIVSPETKGKIILNAITQKDYGKDGKRYVSYDAIAEVMAKVERMDLGERREIAMPMIGAGLGGGDWKVIASIIESELKTVTPIVYQI